MQATHRASAARVARIRLPRLRALELHRRHVLLERGAVGSGEFIALRGGEAVPEVGGGGIRRHRHGTVLGHAEAEQLPELELLNRMALQRGLAEPMAGGGLGVAGAEAAAVGKAELVFGLADTVLRELFPLSELHGREIEAGCGIFAAAEQ